MKNDDYDDLKHHNAFWWCKIYKCALLSQWQKKLK